LIKDAGRDLRHHRAKNPADVFWGFECRIIKSCNGHYTTQKRKKSENYGKNQTVIAPEMRRIIFLGGDKMFDNQTTNYLLTLNSQNTHKSYSRALISFHDWYFTTYAEEPSAELLTDVEVREWRTHLSNACKLSATTVNLHLSAIRSLVRHYGGIITVKGMTKVMPSISPLNGRELGKLLAVTNGDGWLNKRNKAMLELMAKAGLRVSEVAALLLTEIEIRPRLGEVLVRHGKGMKERKIPLGRQVRGALEEYLAVRPENESDWLFVSHTHKPLSPRDIQRMVQKAIYQAGLRRKVTPHILRHTFATRALRSGVDIATLSSLMGHETLTTTARYLHPDKASVAAMVEEL
jgi:integrase/recombinase XerC